MNSPRGSKQLIIGLDAMEWDLVRKWAAAGKLPTFARLMREGTQAELSTVSDRLPDVAWNCLCSGLNPAHLKRYFYVQHDPETGGMCHMSDSSFDAKYFWEELSEAGVRVGVIDVPHVGPRTTFNGFQISWGTHAAQGPRFAMPDSLLHEVDQRMAAIR